MLGPSPLLRLVAEVRLIRHTVVHITSRNWIVLVGRPSLEALKSVLAIIVNVAISSACITFALCSVGAGRKSEVSKLSRCWERRADIVGVTKRVNIASVHEFPIRSYLALQLAFTLLIRVTDPLACLARVLVAVAYIASFGRSIFRIIADVDPWLKLLLALVATRGSFTIVSQKASPCTVV